MKTAISLPKTTFTAATSRAAELGISRSEFFAVAARRYLDEPIDVLPAYLSDDLDRGLRRGPGPLVPRVVS